MKALYTTEVTSSGGREGKIKSKDGVLDLNVALPKELGGSGRPYTNPEQLFAAGYAACFENAILHLARTQKLQIGETSVTAKVSIGPNAAGGFELAAELLVTIAGIDRNIAEELVKVAHEKVCPYSNATRGNIAVTAKLV